MKTYGKALFSDLLRILLLPFHFFKIKENRIVFTGLTGGTTYEYSCNPKYLCEYLLQQEPGRFEILWAVSDPEKYRELEQKGIRLIRHFSFSSLKWLLTAKVIVTNGSYAPWFPFRKNQYVINTWHGGGAYKKIENSKPDANWATRHRARFCADNIDLFISSCKMATEKLIRGSFCFHGEVMEVGMPRNDFLVRQDVARAREKVLQYYGLDADTRILLYAPTYRYSSTAVELDADRLLQTLCSHGQKWAFLYRMHRYQEEGMHLQPVGHSILSASEYPDMQELLAAADMMITDYSSNIWDYSFLFRPCFLYTPDLEEYVKKTGFYVDIEKWPFPTAKTMEELSALMGSVDEQELADRIRAHHQLMGAAETGRACELIGKRITEVCKV